jgi:hypothetical protein
MDRILEVRVMVECLCQQEPKKRGKRSCDPEDRGDGRCSLCRSHPGKIEKWVSYDELLDQIKEDLDPKVDPRSEV